MSAPSTFKLTYFNLRGLGEVPRLLFAAAGQTYEDSRIHFTRQEVDGKVSYDRGEWDSNPAVKEATLFGQVPTLVVDGVTLAQSNAISRYLAKRFGFFGSSDIEAALVDSVGEELQDIRRAWWGAKDKDSAVKPATPEEGAVHKFWTEQLVNYFTVLEKYLTKVPSSAGHFVGDKLSLADVSFYHMMWSFNTEHPVVNDVLPKFPALKAIYDATASQAGIAKWVAERPQTMM